MKTTRNLLLTVIMTALCCSIGRAQLSYSNALTGGIPIYSDAFGGSSGVNITNTPADYESGTLGGKSGTNWIDALGANDTNALHADGSMGTPQGDAWLLPFVPQAGYVYTMNAAVNFYGSPGNWLGAGFCNYHGIIGGTDDRYNTGGVDFGILTESSRNIQSFAGPGATLGYANVNSIWTPATGVHTLTTILDTTGTKWVIASFVDGVQANTNYPYASNPTILGIGLTQNTPITPTEFQWTSFTLSATPVVITKQPVSAAVAAGSAFTNTVVVSAASPGYQWYTNNVPIPGATNASLILNPVTVAEAGTNYYVIVTNSLAGSATSVTVSLTVYSAPVISTAYPVTYTNLTTLYGATNVDGTNYPGSSPKFSVSVLGLTPLHYQWLTNGVAVGGATNTTFALTNCPLNAPTNFAFVVTNIGGAATNTWSVTYVPTPTVLFLAAVLSNNPVGFWRLNEGPDDFAGDEGVPALDYASANNGMYSNAVLGNAGYNSLDPTEGSDRLNYFGAPSDVFGIQGIDFSNNPSATFSVQAWVQGDGGQPNGAGIIAKGYNGGEQFALDVNGNDYRFVVRNGAGTASSVTSSTGPDGNWHFLVGVCDEVNGVVSLYVDGLLAAASVPITPGSAVLPNTTPITIGARGSVPTVFDDLQFNGYISDTAIYNNALSSGQVATLYTAAGFPLGFTFIPPVPPTNFVFQANLTLTIPAIAFGATPIGYYWTNLTTGGIIESGTTNVLGNLNASLVIPNAPASLSGDQLELVVTNAGNSTNVFVTLFSPAPPVTLDYSNPILYSNYFNGGTWTIAGTPLTAANVLVGGTNTTWSDALGINDTGELQASGISATTLGDSWLLPFMPHSGYVYTLSAAVTLASYPGSWVGLGFAQSIPTNATLGAAFNSGAVNGYAWDILTAGATLNLQAFQGAAGVGQCVDANNFYPAEPATYTNTVVLDTTGTNWTAAFYVDGVLGGTTNYATTPPISAFGITQNALSAPGNIQWDYVSLTQVAPGGVPPYLLAPLPSTNSILLTNGTATIAATAFGSAPLGYYWSNNSTIIASGVTNNMAPLPATLSIPDTSLSAGQLELVVTNAYGTNTTLITLISTVNPYPGPIHFSVTGNQLTMGWPTNLGWTLQVQTNTLSSGLGANWVNVPGSTTVTNIVVPMNPTNGSVFYRLHN